MSSESLKIAIVSSQFFSETDTEGGLKVFEGGLASYTYRLAKSLQQFGHKPVLFVTSEISEKVIFDGIEVHKIASEKYDEWLYKNKYLCKPYTHAKRLFFRSTPWRNLEIKLLPKYLRKIQSSGLNKLIRQINKEQHFDIIHFTHLGGVGYYRPKNIPCIARLSSHTSLYQKFGGYGRPDNEMLNIERMEIAALKKMDGIFGPSRMIGSVTEKEINRKIEIIESIFVEGSTNLDYSLYEQHLKEKKYLLWYGTAGLIKGAGTIAQIIYPFLKNYPDYYFVFIGKTLHSEIPGTSMKDFIKAKAAEYSDRVLFFDTVPQPKLYPIIQHSTFCTLPSRIDNFPNTCIEAMGHGKIVIGTIGNGFEQLIDDKKSGYLIPVDAPDKLLQAIEDILRLSPEEKKQIETNAKSRIKQLSPESIVPQLIRFYKAAILKHQSKFINKFKTKK